MCKEQDLGTDPALATILEEFQAGSGLTDEELVSLLGMSRDRGLSVATHLESLRGAGLVRGPDGAGRWWLKAGLSG